MEEATTASASDRCATTAQAGRLLCVSETIYPHGLNHGLKPVYRGMHMVGGAMPLPYVRIAGKEHLDLRTLVPAVESARHSSRQAYGGFEGIHMKRDGGR
ncbi:MAG: hypothetical protein JW854_04050 [Actinobacteria bacterium]|nr:hypothetical protein [Actinomycetota bacterium]